MATTFAVPDGRVAMAATLYTGTGVARSVSNAVNTVSFAPDFVWIKDRTTAYSHILFDTIRGAGNYLISNGTLAETTDTNYMSAFTSTGFSVGTSAVSNGNTENYVGWQWKAGGTAVSNTAGTITSSVSANTTAGFSVSTFTTPMSGAFTFGHGLGVVPSMVIVKRRGTTSSWGVWHTSLSGGTYYVLLDSTGVQVNDSTVFTATPTASVVNMGSAWPAGSAQTMVAYCWAPVAGYSAFGSYTGNGSADGPFVYTGFRPRWIMIKDITVAGNQWNMYDTSRDAHNVASNTLYADSSAVADTNRLLDILSNGFKPRVGAGYGINATGSTYIYACFAENPLRYANAR
jgi:hypothetical protein